MDAARKHGTRISDYMYADDVDLCDYDGVFAEEEDAVEINGSPAEMPGIFVYRERKTSFVL